MCCGLAPANNKEPCSCSPTPPALVGWGELEEKTKLMGWDEDSLTEQQRKRKITTVILQKKIHRMLATRQSFLSTRYPACS